jgi:hypothetical protein
MDRPGDWCPLGLEEEPWWEEVDTRLPLMWLHFTGFVLAAPQVLWSKIGIDVLHFDKVLDLF